jgi:hypothetical protein
MVCKNGITCLLTELSGGGGRVEITIYILISLMGEEGGCGIHTKEEQKIP